MASSTDNTHQLAYDFPPLIRVYKDGRVERLLGNETVPPSVDPKTGVKSKDVSIAAGVSARLYLPRLSPSGGRKLPLLIYFHGGGFCIESAFSPVYHNYLNSLVAEANVVAVSVDYRLAPEHPVPAAYDDSWTAVKWVAGGGGGEPWLSDHADLRRTFLAGDSAGANIAHHVAMRFGREPEPVGEMGLEGIVLVNPYFWGEEPVGAEAAADPARREHAARLWRFVCPESADGCDDPRMNPAKEGEELRRLGGRRVLVTVAEKDLLRDRGFHYTAALEKSGWGGSAELVDVEEEEHVFHLFKPGERAAALLKRVAAFLNQ